MMERCGSVSSWSKAGEGLGTTRLCKQLSSYHGSRASTKAVSQRPTAPCPRPTVPSALVWETLDLAGSRTGSRGHRLLRPVPAPVENISRWYGSHLQHPEREPPLSNPAYRRPVGAGGQDLAEAEPRERA